MEIIHIHTFSLVNGFSLSLSIYIPFACCLPVSTLCYNFTVSSSDSTHTQCLAQRFLWTSPREARNSIPSATWKTRLIRGTVYTKRHMHVTLRGVVCRARTDIMYCIVTGTYSHFTYVRMYVRTNCTTDPFHKRDMSCHMPRYQSIVTGTFSHFTLDCTYSTYIRTYIKTQQLCLLYNLHYIWYSPFSLWCLVMSLGKS